MPQGVPCSDDVGVAVQFRNRMFREAVAARIDVESGLRVVGATERGAELPQLCELRGPQIVVFEVAADQEGLLRTITTLRNRHRRLYLVGCYDRPDPGLAERLRLAGVNRVVASSGGIGALLSVLRQPAWDLGNPNPPTGGYLTDRELRVLHLISSGYSREQVGAALQITPRTVESYKRRIYAKLHAHSQAHAAANGVRLGLLPSPARPAPPAQPPEPAVGQPAVALLAGARGPLAEQAGRLLIAAHIPLIQDYSGLPASAEHPARHVRGPLLAVLIDPLPADWTAALDLPSRTIIVHSAEPAQATLAAAVLAGVDAMLPADDLAVSLLPTFRLVAAGYQVLNVRPARRLLAAAFTRLGSGPQPPIELTRRERQILLAIEKGHSVKQTARALGISVKTVESLQSGLFRKVGAHTRAEALVIAHGLGLITDTAN